MIDTTEDYSLGHSLLAQALGAAGADLGVPFLITTIVGRTLAGMPLRKQRARCGGHVLATATGLRLKPPAKTFVLVVCVVHAFYAD